uniref:Anti-bacteriophage protein A/HamA C-terminal domain-containing protein n=1 Tax=Geobacter sp. (strain M21) TaxID=443144 RepID=C6E4Y1_GEOSM
MKSLWGECAFIVVNFCGIQWRCVIYDNSLYEILSMNTELLLSKTTDIVDKIHYVRHDFSLLPNKDHLGICIKHVDINELRHQFVSSLCASIIKFIYCDDGYEKLKKEFGSCDEQTISGKIYQKAKQKFRPYSKRGQFSELLVFTLLQHFFKAVPFLRKGSITTNPEMERNGADALHIKYNPITKKYELYIAECKTKNAFSGAFHECLDDAIVHYKRMFTELELYIYEDFISPELEPVVADFLNGKLENLETNLVCLMTYENEHPLTGGVGTLNDEMMESLLTSAKKISHTAVTKKVDPYILNRIHYIMFPVNDLEALIETFEDMI